jgi:hypothetical protein
MEIAEIVGERMKLEADGFGGFSWPCLDLLAQCVVASSLRNRTLAAYPPWRRYLLFLGHFQCHLETPKPRHPAPRLKNVDFR